jgi:hypothetical protein
MTLSHESRTEWVRHSLDHPMGGQETLASIWRPQRQTMVAKHDRYWTLQHSVRFLRESDPAYKIQSRTGQNSMTASTLVVA